MGVESESVVWGSKPVAEWRCWWSAEVVCGFGLGLAVCACLICLQVYVMTVHSQLLPTHWLTAERPLPGPSASLRVKRAPHPHRQIFQA